MASRLRNGVCASRAGVEDLLTAWEGWVERIGLRGVHGFAQVRIGGTFVGWREPMRLAESDVLPKGWRRRGRV